MPEGSHYVARRALAPEVIISVKRMEFGRPWHGSRSWPVEKNQLKKYSKTIGLLMVETFLQGIDNLQP